MNKLKKLLYIFILLMTVFVVGCNNDKEDDKGDKPLTEAEIIEKVNQEFSVLDSETIKFTRNNGNSSDVNTVTFLSVNDFHGALEASDGEFGAARMGGYIISRHNENPNGTVLLSAGDMFQGTGISNYRHGRDTLTFMNALGFDAMSLGNHEFDWTLDEVLKYLDGNKANGEASFPFLGCNVIDTRTNELPEHILPYTIIVKNKESINYYYEL